MSEKVSFRRTKWDNFLLRGFLRANGHLKFGETDGWQPGNLETHRLGKSATNTLKILFTLLGRLQGQKITRPTNDHFSFDELVPFMINSACAPTPIRRYSFQKYCGNVRTRTFKFKRRWLPKRDLRNFDQLCLTLKRSLPLNREIINRGSTALLTLGFIHTEQGPVVQLRGCSHCNRDFFVTTNELYESHTSH